MSQQTAPHTYRMGIIGNCNYVALVEDTADIRWMCWPKFDSSFVFGSLLDQEKGGSFSIRPSGKNFSSEQSYITNTNVLRTRIKNEDGEYEVTDFAPRFMQDETTVKPLMLLRKVRRLSGNPKIVVTCKPVGKYGEVKASTKADGNRLNFAGLDKPVSLLCNVPLDEIQMRSPMTLTNDLYFVLSWGEPFSLPLETGFEDYLRRTTKYWQRWVEHCNVPRVFQKEVIRSALTLKLHQYEDTGGIIASCTTSLPESPGEGRNWDYRYCWLRDTYYTLNAFIALGHFEEMEAYARFIENLKVESLEKMQPLYSIEGQAEIFEKELPLAGYLGNQPVRVGNAAYMQTQHDAYGQILLALFTLYTDARLFDRKRLPEGSLRHILGYIERHMDAPDNGVWEFRGRQSVHAYTLLFHWAGSAACRKIAAELKDSSLLVRADAAMQKAGELLEKCFDAKKGAYMQSIGSENLDASLLQMITLGYFHDRNLDEAIRHMRAIQKELEIQPGFFWRYKHQDDFGLPNTAFLVCGFWYIEALATLGFTKEATAHFEHLLTAQNHLGLMSEDFDIRTRSQWGNFPQTYSHVGLINCAFALDRALNKPAFL